MYQADTFVTSNITTLDTEKLPTSSSFHFERLNQIQKGEIALYITGNEQLIHLTRNREYTLGRQAEGQSIFPDVDLTSFQAHNLGVSRLHAVLRVSENQVKIKDLGSINKTFINKKPIPPKKLVTLHHGDTITLGKLDILILMPET
ncbi:MAG: FHA domain-containing protein [Anaerolineales bacterium]